MKLSITNLTDKPMHISRGSIAGLRYDHTPYCREILNLLDPNAPAKEVIFMKGASIGITAGVIPGATGYFITPEIKEL